MDAQRLELLEKRRQLDKDLRLAYDHRIFETVKFFLKPGMKVGCYIAMEDEVATKDIITWYVNIGNCAVPKCLSQGQMQFYPIDEATSFTKNKYGIWEPTSDEIVIPQDIDIMIVPMVGFDELNHRIGHGAGYYDRYLANISCVKIGIAYEEQKVSFINTKPHDIDMDIIITQHHIYHKGL